jgi:hypothetical protein
MAALRATGGLLPPPAHARSGAARGLHRSGRSCDRPPSHAAIRFVCHRRPAGRGRSATPESVGDRQGVPAPATLCRAFCLVRPRAGVSDVDHMPVPSAIDRPSDAAMGPAPSIGCGVTLGRGCGGKQRAAPPAQATIRCGFHVDRQGVAGCRTADARAVADRRGARSGREQAHSPDRLRSAAPALTSSPCFERRKAFGLRAQKVRPGAGGLAPMRAAASKAAAADERRSCSPAATARGARRGMEQVSTGRDPRGRAPGSKSLPDACGSECQ